jgi:cellulose biosynthesis protein BcsQ
VALVLVFVVPQGAPTTAACRSQGTEDSNLDEDEVRAGHQQGAAEVRAIVARLARRRALTVRALVRTAVDRRRVVYQRMSDGLEDLGLPIAETEIPLTAASQNAAADRRPLLAVRPDNAGSIAYWQLARELLPVDRTETS